MGAGGFYLSGGYVESVHKDLFKDFDDGDDAPIYAKNPEEFQILIDYYLDDNQKSDKETLTKWHQEFILNEHTYFNRVTQMFSELKMEKETELILKKKREFLNEQIHNSN